MPVSQSIRAKAAIKNIANKKLELVHPWSLAALPDDAAQSDNLRIGIIHLPAHADWPWSERRWRFVLGAMAQVTSGIWAGDITELDTSAAPDITAQATLFPGYREALPRLATLLDAPHLLPNPVMACRSFSKFYERARRGVPQFADLL